MITEINEEDKNEVKKCFQDWLDVQDRKEQLNDENKELINATSFILDVKKPIVTKFFKAWKKKVESGGALENDEVEELLELIGD
jgi:hypothetical protein